MMPIDPRECAATYKEVIPQTVYGTLIACAERLEWRQGLAGIKEYEGQIVLAFDGQAIWAAGPVYDDAGGWLFYPVGRFESLTQRGHFNIDLEDEPLMNEDTGRNTVTRWMPLPQLPTFSGNTKEPLNG